MHETLKGPQWKDPSSHQSSRRKESVAWTEKYRRWKCESLNWVAQESGFWSWEKNINWTNKGCSKGKINLKFKEENGRGSR